MAKRSGNKDETPIIWEIPGFRKGPRPPIPVNQPHWVYKNLGSTKPTIGSIVTFTVLGLLLFGVIGSIFLRLSTESQIWFAKPLLTVLLGLGIYGWVLLIKQQIVLYRTLYKRDNAQEGKSREKQRKVPKRRKDYH